MIKKKITPFYPLNPPPQKKISKKRTQQILQEYFLWIDTSKQAKKMVSYLYPVLQFLCINA